MKMVMIAYNEAIDDEVSEILAGCSIKSYTKLAKVFGSGLLSGTHLGNEIWPGLNNALYVACEDDKARTLITKVKEARQKLGSEGVKAFVMPLEEMT